MRGGWNGVRAMRGPVVVLSLVLASGGVALPGGVAAASALPAGFQETVVFSGLINPMVVRFASDGRVFVAEKSGLIKVFDSLTDSTPTVFADLRTNVHDFWDRGLMGMALDPAFPSSPYVYVLYAYDHVLGSTAPAPRWGDQCPASPGATADGCVISGRVSRLQASGSQMTGPEQVLVEDWCQQYPSHSVGSLTFGPDGALYASGGDGASFNWADYGQDGNPLNPCGDPPAGVGGTQTAPSAEGGALRSQDLRTSADPVSLDGSIIRIDPATGAGLSTNPFAGSPDPNLRRIIAYGLRNPFRMANRPGTNELWLGDVGWSTWEELNRIVNSVDSVVENFGWPCYEGVGRQVSYDNLNLNLCENLYAAGTSAVTAPYYTYRHADSIVAGEACASGQGSSTVGIAFYNGGSYPASYDGTLFFADYSRDCLWVMPRGTNGLPDPARRANFLAPAANPVHLEIGPGGDLFYVDLNGGTIRRIQYVGTNQPPTAVATANPTSGPAPLAVTFDARASSDPENGALTFAWDVNGDGAFGEATGATTTYTYQQPGTYSARVRVTDPQGASSTSAPIAINAANTLPVPVIDSPVAGTRWKVGDAISFSGHATDAEDGTLAGSALSWAVVLMHCPQDCHEHPLQTFAGVTSGSFAAPDHEYPAHLELRLTATDRFGASSTVSRRLDPQTVQLSMQTVPSGLTLEVGGSSQVTPFTRTVIAGGSTTITAPTPQDVSGARYVFTSWSDGGAATHTVPVGTTNAAFTATYRATGTDLAIASHTATSGRGRVTLSVGVRNGGPDAATGVVLTDTLPSKLAFQSASPGCTWAAASRTVTCPIGDLAAGAAAQREIVATYKGKASSENTVSVRASTDDVNAANNTSRITFKLL